MIRLEDDDSTEQNDAREDIIFIPVASNLGRFRPANLSGENTTISLHPVYDNPEDTLKNIATHGVTENDPLIAHAVGSGTYFKRIGAEVLIYSCSYGGVGIISGLFIRFLGVHPLVGMVSGNALSVFSNEFGRVLFTSLINPHGEKFYTSQDSGRFSTLKQYLGHPLSTVLTSTLGGGVTSLFGSTNLGTRQMIVSCTAQAGGMTTYAVQTLFRKCLGGSIVINPPKDWKREAKAYFSTETNPATSRPYVVGNGVNVLTRLTGMLIANFGTWYTGLYDLENFCGPTGGEILRNMNGTYTGDDVRKYCIGGQSTFLFRDWSLACVGLIGFLVIQPMLTKVLNALWDCFFVSEENGESVSIEEVQNVLSDDDEARYEAFLNSLEESNDEDQSVELDEISRSDSSGSSDETD
ncbi:hypothetical protein [Govanella unica]|uniref:Uncharacterized protein n=1 Tax=Govanella unica TaxID=2975056 RepID=A0A9X3TWF3_9PROT|nr:hypothetical protein [Govania unica]MDA5192819.1 hypothetical protein [Govania unica]